MARRQTYQRWTAEELDYLTENYSDETAEDIARHLGRTPDSIWEKADRAGLRKYAERRHRNPDGPWWCPSCKKSLPVDNFGKGEAGRGTAYCTECNNRLSRERRQAAARKKGKPRGVR